METGAKDANPPHQATEPASGQVDPVRYEEPSEFARALASARLADIRISQLAMFRSFRVVSKIDTLLYEIDLASDMRYETVNPASKRPHCVLKTLVTEFRSTGESSMAIRFRERVKAEDAAGFDRYWCVFEEALSDNSDPLTWEEVTAARTETVNSFFAALDEIDVSLRNGHFESRDLPDLVNLIAMSRSVDGLDYLYDRKESRELIANALSRLEPDSGDLLISLVKAEVGQLPGKIRPIDVPFRGRIDGAVLACQFLCKHPSLLFGRGEEIRRIRDAADADGYWVYVRSLNDVLKRIEAVQSP